MTVTISLAPNVTLRAMQSEKFKTACFSVNFITRHDRAHAAKDALLPSVLLRATERYPDIRSISIRLDELYGATFGTLVRRKGERKLTGFYADFIEDAFLPAGEEVFAPMVEFLEQVLFFPYREEGCFCRRYVEGEKQNLINAIESSLNSKRSYATLELLKAMCDGEDYGVPRLGTVEDVQSITPQILWDHYEAVLRQAPIEIFYMGRRSPEEVAELFRRVFAPRCTEPRQMPKETEVRRHAVQSRELSGRLDVTQGKLVMGLRTGIIATDPDYPALLLLNTVFGSGITSKLFANVREKLSLCYYADSSVDKHKGLMIISSGIAFENYEKAKDAILAQLRACQEGQIAPEELEAAKRQVLSAYRGVQDSPTQLDEIYSGIAVEGGMEPQELMAAIEPLRVEDLVRAANQLTLDTIYFLKGESE